MFELFLLSVALALFLLSLFFWLLYVLRRGYAPLKLHRVRENPILGPLPASWWESEAVFNPAALVHDGRVHLLYRALGHDGISRIGHASSADGVHFDERSPTPVYDRGAGFTPTPQRLSYRTLSYNTDTYASGGGWGGTEDPRAVTIDDRVYISFGIFDSWQSMRMAVTSLAHVDFDARAWKWAPHINMSPQGQTNKNWVLFPQKIRGKFAILHALTPTIMIEYVDRLEDLHENPIQSNNKRSGRAGHWDALIRGAGAPPLLTPHGWLLFYHGMDPAKNTGYEVGAMLLDLHDPTKILYQTSAPILTATEWYENDWKPGVVYASGAVIFHDELFVYYGGGDKHIAAARLPLKEFLAKLMRPQNKI